MQNTFLGLPPAIHLKSHVLGLQSAQPSSRPSSHRLGAVQRWLALLCVFAGFWQTSSAYAQLIGPDAKMLYKVQRIDSYRIQTDTNPDTGQINKRIFCSWQTFFLGEDGQLTTSGIVPTYDYAAYHSDENYTNWTAEFEATINWSVGHLIYSYLSWPTTYDITKPTGTDWFDKWIVDHKYYGPVVNGFGEMWFQILPGGSGGGGGTGKALLTPTSPMTAVDSDRPGIDPIDYVPTGSSYPPTENPSCAIDGTVSTKYRNYGGVNSGFIVSPSGGASVVSSLEIWTANDSPDSDPVSYKLYGTNSAITSSENSTGTSENWTLIAEGALPVPTARQTSSGKVTFANTTSYRSYKWLATALRNTAATEMQLSEIQFYARSTGGGDLNGDGIADLIFQNSAGQIVGWTMNGAGVPVTGITIYPGGLGDWRVVAMADVNGDGIADLVFQNTAGQIVAWTMNGAGAPVTGISIYSGGLGDWRVVAMADVNGDGIADLIFQNGPGQIAAWTMNGAGSPVAGISIYSGGLGDWRAVAMADVNSDGIADLIFQNGPGQIAAWTMNGAGVPVTGISIYSGSLGTWRAH